MRNYPVLFIALLTTACGSNSCFESSPSSGCAHWGGYMTADAPKTSTASAAEVTDEEPDSIELVTTEDGVFAIASIHSSDEQRTYRVEATDVDEAPITVTLVGKVALHDVQANVPNAMITLDDTSAYVTDGDAYLLARGDAAFTRIGAPGITRGVALADVTNDTTTRRVVALQTESPRMLVFFLASDTTNPIAFEPLE
jgi:hypothetical protein